MRQFSVGGVLALSRDSADKLISARDGDAALLYIYILKNGGALDESVAMARLGFTEQRLITALKTLQSSELLDAPAEPAAPVRALSENYSEGELADLIEGDHDFRHLTEETQRRLGKVLSTAELTTLLGLYNTLGLPASVISLLVTHCTEEARRKYGDGRMPTMRQIEREAYSWERLGIFDVVGAEQYLAGLEQRRESVRQVLRVMHLTGRPASASEERYIREWLNMGFDSDTIYMAYDLTVLKTGALKWSYMNSILKSWSAKGLLTVEQVEQGDRPPKKEAAKAPHQPGEHERRALEWLNSYDPKAK